MVKRGGELNTPAQQKRRKELLTKERKEEYITCRN
jgi:hypothetical protein